MTDPRAIAAARNNADWYSMMFDIHGLLYQRSQSVFLAIDAPPPYHSWMTTLDPASDAEHLGLVSRHVFRPGFGIKDSFHRLDLATHGLVELFSAKWIWADAVPVADTTAWKRITSPENLNQWEAAWSSNGSPSDQQQFPPAILRRPEVAIWGRVAANGFDAGVVANISPDCVGLSNCFGDEAFPAAATLCAGYGQGLAVVGYERDDGLAAALRSDFETTGTLRVWCKPT